MVALSLYELNNLVRSLIDATFTQTYWLKAELSEVRESEAGHCYLTFVEKDGRSDQPVALAEGRIWKSTYNVLRPYFERETGQRLTPGMTVLVEVSIHFHERYGYSLYVEDIDPTYTLGDQSRHRREIVARLEREGVAALNRELPWPRPANRIAIISSATAAGLGDFCHQLEASPYRFTARLFQAVMQGEQTESSIIHALDRIAEERDQWDIVVIIRGGGAVSDLSGFDTYDLADNVAQFPLPVLSGIGHERDETVIDLVAYERLKTPTAVAAYLIDRMAAEADALNNLTSRINRAVTSRMYCEKIRFDHTANHLLSAFSHYASFESYRADTKLRRLAMAIERRSIRAHTDLQQLRSRLAAAALRLLTDQRHHVDLIGQRLEATDPDRILRLGYSITLSEGKLVTSTDKVRPGDRLTTRLADGTIESVVQ